MMEKIKRFASTRAFFVKLIQGNSNESSKRFAAIYTLLALITYATVRYTTVDNVVQVLGMLCGFVLALFGISVWQDVRNNRISKENPKE